MKRSRVKYDYVLYYMMILSYFKKKKKILQYFTLLLVDILFVFIYIIAFNCVIFFYLILNTLVLHRL